MSDGGKGGNGGSGGEPGKSGNVKIFNGYTNALISSGYNAIEGKGEDGEGGGYGVGGAHGEVWKIFGKNPPPSNPGKPGIAGIHIFGKQKAIAFKEFKKSDIQTDLLTEINDEAHKALYEFLYGIELAGEANPML